MPYDAAVKLRLRDWALGIGILALVVIVEGLLVLGLIGLQRL